MLESLKCNPENENFRTRLKMSFCITAVEIQTLGVRVARLRAQICDHLNLSALYLTGASIILRLDTDKLE